MRDETIIPLPELLGHGQHIRVQYLGAAWGQSTDEERKPGNVVGTLARFKKRSPTGGPPQALGWIKATYEDAIEYSGLKQELEGMAMIWGVAGPFLGIGMTAAFIAGAISVNYWTIWLITLFAASIGLLFTYWMFLNPFRHVWRVPRDLPIIFNRRHRKVYRMLQDVQPGLAGLRKPWPVKAVAYEWDLLDAEHDVQLMTTSNSAMRLHRLAFVVRKSAQDPTIIDHFEIGSAMSQSEAFIEPMWEHIRRFMEEGGPHLPHPTEPLNPCNRDKPTWWQACGRAGPFGSRYFAWWKERPGMTLIMYHSFVAMATAPIIWFLRNPAWSRIDAFGWSLLILMIPISMNWGQGTGIWLMANTAKNYDWPQAVKDAVGPATRRGEGWW